MPDCTKARYRINSKAAAYPSNYKNVLKKKKTDSFKKAISSEWAKSRKEDVFLQQTVITAKKDTNVKIALDARKLNKNVVKDEHPTPNLDNLMDMIVEHVGGYKTETFFGEILNITYAYGQAELSPDMSKQCNFHINGGEAT